MRLLPPGSGRILLGTGSLLLVLVLLSWGLGLWWAMGRIPAPPRPPAASVRLVDRQGRLLRLFTTADGYFRLPARLEATDPDFIQALLAMEDRRFHRHHGVDPLALLRAAGQVLVHGRVVSGASTITMQCVRLLQPRPRTLASKIREMFLALALERRLSKDEILTLYLSLCPYGGNIQGIEAASLLYFGHAPVRLTPSERALLIALPQSPERRRPDRHARAARLARNRVLRRLEREGLLDAASVRAAMERPLPRRRPAPALAPHLAWRLRAARPEEAVLRCTLDRALQNRIELLARQAGQDLPPGLDLAILVVDNHSGEVRAMAGSSSYFTASRLDLTRAVRSPGSLLKPLIYGLAFEQGFLHPLSLVQDRAGRFGHWRPVNFSGGFAGEVTAAEALGRSLNLPAVRVLRRLGPSRLLDRLERAGLAPRLPEHGGDQASLALALGGLGMTLEQAVTLYRGLAAEGLCQELAFEPGADRKRARLLEPGAAWQVTDILRHAPLAPGLARNRELAIKTGTSYGYRDAWALGFDPDWTVGVWVGRPDGGSGLSITGGRTAVPVLLRAAALLPPCRAPWPPPPPGLPRVSRTADLPPSLRRMESGPLFTPAQAPLRIVHPADGARLRLRAGRFLLCEAQGGAPPYVWLVNGRPVATDGQGRGLWRPDGPGEARIQVVDAQGRSQEARAWLESAGNGSVQSSRRQGGMGEEVSAPGT